MDALKGVPKKVLSRRDAAAIYMALVRPAEDIDAKEVPSLADFLDHVGYGDEYKGKVVVRLCRDFYRGGSFESTELVSAKWWNHWSEVDPWVYLGEVNGKHSEVRDRLSNLVYKVIYDPDDIYALSKHEKLTNVYLHEENFSDENHKRYPAYDENDENEEDEDEEDDGEEDEDEEEEDGEEDGEEEEEDGEGDDDDDGHAGGDEAAAASESAHDAPELQSDAAAKRARVADA